MITSIKVPGTVALKNTSTDGAQTAGSVKSKRVTVKVRLEDEKACSDTGLPCTSNANCESPALCQPVSPDSCQKGTSQPVTVLLELRPPSGSTRVAGTQTVGLTAPKAAKVRFDVQFTPADCPDGEGPPPKNPKRCSISGELCSKNSDCNPFEVCQGGSTIKTRFGLVCRASVDGGQTFSADFSNFVCKPSKETAAQAP